MNTRYVAGFVGVILLCCSCSDAFIKHRMEFQKNGSCTTPDPAIRMQSNTNGERYQFSVCLPESFSGTEYQIDRRGDSLWLHFTAPGARNTACMITLDIDAKPAYHYIEIEGQGIQVVPYYK